MSCPAQGRTFMAGDDLGAMHDDPPAAAHELIAGVRAGIRIFIRRAVPVIARPHGAVARSAPGLALACDLGAPRVA